ncbi:MAG: porin [Usitatibacteraceae bacterium]
MQAKQLALTVACLCAGTAAMAQTANPVTLYGRIYVAFDSVRANGGAAPVSSRNRVTDRVSLIGFRGSEDLGGGLKAFFQLESAAPPDAGGGTFGSRNSGVGLAGNWGTLLLGRWDTPFKVAHAAVIDPFGDVSSPDITGAALNQGNFSRRENNAIQYWSPKMGAFSFRAHYTANEVRTATANPSVVSTTLTYADGPLYVAYGYERHKDLNGTTATAGVSENGNALSAYYRFGSLKLSGQAGRYTRTGTERQNSYMVGLDWALGKHVILATYQNSKNGGVTTAAQPKCNLAGVGYRYDFSKRTSFTTDYTKVDNQVGNLCNFGTSGLTITAGQDPRGFSAGMRHTF